MFFIKNYKLDIYIKNNEEEYNFKNINSKYKDDKYIFDIDNDKYEITIKDDIIFHKENDESVLDFNFKDNVITTGTYYIKELNFYMDAKVKTTKLDLDKILVEYKLWLQDEEIGNFIFKMKVKE